MIDKIKSLQYKIRDVEKYLFGILRYESIKYHPDIENNRKQKLKEYVDILVDVQDDLRYVIDNLNLKITRGK